MMHSLCTHLLRRNCLIVPPEFKSKSAESQDRQQRINPCRNWMRNTAKNIEVIIPIKKREANALSQGRAIEEKFTIPEFELRGQ